MVSPWDISFEEDPKSWVHWCGNPKVWFEEFGKVGFEGVEVENFEFTKVGFEGTEFENFEFRKVGENRIFGWGLPRIGGRWKAIRVVVYARSGSIIPFTFS